MEAAQISAAVSKDWRNTVSMKHDRPGEFTIDYLPSCKKVRSDLRDLVDACKNMPFLYHKKHRHFWQILVAFLEIYLNSDTKVISP